MHKSTHAAVGFLITVAVTTACGSRSSPAGGSSGGGVKRYTFTTADRPLRALTRVGFALKAPNFRMLGLDDESEVEC